MEQVTHITRKNNSQQKLDPLHVLRHVYYRYF